jgi:hypothetical protein
VRYITFFLGIAVKMVLSNIAVSRIVKRTMGPGIAFRLNIGQ